MSDDDFLKLSQKARSLVRHGKYRISLHALEDHPERQITAVDILEVLKIGHIATAEPNMKDGKTLYSGDQRYRWFGEDQNDRVLRLIIAVKGNVVVISAAEATEGQARRYREDEKE